MDILAAGLALVPAIVSFATLKAQHASLEKRVEKLEDEYGELDELYMRKEMLDQKFTNLEKSSQTTQRLTANTRDLLFQLVLSAKIPVSPELILRAVKEENSPDG